MLEIIALIFLTKDIGKIADKKGLKPLTWKIYTVLGWVIAEIVGFVIALMFFDKTNLFSIIIVGLTFAITSFYIIRSKLNEYPDAGMDDDINNLGR